MKTKLGEGCCTSSSFIVPAVEKFNIIDFFVENYETCIDVDQKFWEKMILGSNSKFAQTDEITVTRFEFPAIFTEAVPSDFDIAEKTGTVSVSNKLKLLAVIKGLILMQSKIDVTPSPGADKYLSSSQDHPNIFYFSEWGKVVAKIEMRYILNSGDFNKGKWELKFKEKTQFKSQHLGPNVYCF